jgi:hypothetical protein
VNEMPKCDLVVKFFWEPPADLLGLYHGDETSKNLIPPEIKTLAGTDLANHILVMSKVRDEMGALGVLTEIETPPQDESHEWDVYLSIVMPHRGALFVRQTKKGQGHIDNPGLVEACRIANDTGEWVGELEHMATAGPLPGGYGEVIAGTGEFSGMIGRQQQMVHFRRLTSELMDASNVETFWLSRKS